MHSPHPLPSAGKEDLTRYLRREKSFLPFFSPSTQEESFPVQDTLEYSIELTQQFPYLLFLLSEDQMCLELTNLAVTLTFITVTVSTAGNNNRIRHYILTNETQQLIWNRIIFF